MEKKPGEEKTEDKKKKRKNLLEFSQNCRKIPNAWHSGSNLTINIKHSQCKFTYVASS